MRGLLALNLAVAAAGSMVFVNTVVLVKGTLGGTGGNVAVALSCFGGGSMAAALLLPRRLDRLPDRRTMLSSAEMLAAFGVMMGGDIWKRGRQVRVPAEVGAIGDRLLRREGALRAPAAPVSRRCRPAGRVRRSVRIVAPVLAADLPLAAWLGLSAGIAPTALVLAAVTLTGVLLAVCFWPVVEADLVPHQHPELTPDHPHLRGQSPDHAHAYVLDDLHPRWP